MGIIALTPLSAAAARVGSKATAGSDFRIRVPSPRARIYHLVHTKFSHQFVRIGGNAFDRQSRRIACEGSVGAVDQLDARAISGPLWTTGRENTTAGHVANVSK